MNFDFIRDPEWLNLDPETKRGVLSIAFQRDIKSDPEWGSLPTELQTGVQKTYLDEAFKAEQAAAIEAAPERRGFFGRAGSALARGTVRTIESAGQALELADLTPREADKEEGILDKAGRGIVDWSQRVQKEYAFLKQDKGELLGEPGFIQRGLIGIPENIPQTLPIIAGAWTGAKLGAGAGGIIAGPPGAAAGAVVGSVTGAIASLVAIFGAGNYGQEYSSAYQELGRTRPEATEEERREVAHRVALRSAVLEVGTEIPGSLLALRIVGGTKVLTQPLVATLRNVLTKPRAEFAKEFAAAAAGEVGGEMIAGGGQAWARQAEGLSGPTVFQGVTEAIIPTMGMSLFFGGAAAGYNRVQTNRAMNELNSDNARTRVDAINTMTYRLAANTQDKDLALAWRGEALKSVETGEKFDFDEKVIEFAKVKTAEDYQEKPEAPFDPSAISAATNTDEALEGFVKTVESGKPAPNPLDPLRGADPGLTLKDLAAVPADQAQRMLADEGPELFAGQQVDYTTPKGAQRVTLIEQNEDGTWRGKTKDFLDITIRPDRAIPAPVLESGRQIEYQTKRGTMLGVLVEPLGETAWRAKQLDNGKPFTALIEKMKPIASFGEILPEARKEVQGAPRLRSDAGQVLPGAPSALAEDEQRKAGAGISKEEALRQRAGAGGPNIQRLAQGEPGGAVRLDITEAAHEAATSPKNDLAQPTQLQKEAGNYKKGHLTFEGLDISIENPEGSTRSGVSEDGKKWETPIQQGHYGYIKGTVGKDKDHIDTFISTTPREGAPVFVVDQVNPKTGTLDEHKAMLGYGSIEEAKDAYLANYEKGWKGLGAITETTVEDFKEWTVNGDQKKNFASAVPQIPTAEPKAVEWKSRKSMGLTFHTTPLEGDTLVIQEMPTKGKNKFVVYKKSDGPVKNIGKFATLEEAKAAGETIIPGQPSIRVTNPVHEEILKAFDEHFAKGDIHPDTHAAVKHIIDIQREQGIIDTIEFRKDATHTYDGRKLALYPNNPVDRALLIGYGKTEKEIDDAWNRKVREHKGPGPVESPYRIYGEIRVFDSGERRIGYDIKLYPGARAEDAYHEVGHSLINRKIIDPGPKPAGVSQSAHEEAAAWKIADDLVAGKEVPNVRPRVVSERAAVHGKETGKATEPDRQGSVRATPAARGRQYAISEKPEGYRVTAPAESYDRGVNSKGNVWVRQSETDSNAGRQLMVQFSSGLINKDFGPDAASQYNDEVYGGKREGYDRLQDFWEIPQWMGFASKFLPNADVYVVRNMAEAKKFINAAGYDRILFSSIDVNKALVKELSKSFDGTVDIGGYTVPGTFDDINAKWHESLESLAKDMGVPYEEGVDYRHFKDSKVIPRLTMSQGCLHKCAFCTVPKQLIETSIKVIDQQAEAFSTLDAKLVYLNDKTFGQAKNYTHLEHVYSAIKEKNPGFKGFVIQTTGTQLLKMDDAWLQRSGIKYVELGVETYNDAILKSMHKPHNTGILDKAVQKLRDNKIALIPNVIIGLPGETRETYQRTLDFLDKNKDIISHYNVNNLALYTGTELTEEMGGAKAKSDLDENQYATRKSFHTEEQAATGTEFAEKVYAKGVKEGQYSIQESLDEYRPKIATQYAAMIRTAFERMVKKFGPGLNGIYNAVEGRHYRETVSAAVETAPQTTPFDRHPVKSISEERLAKIADKYAEDTIDTWKGKIEGKIGDLDGAEVKHLDGYRFLISGTRDGSDISIEQDMIINVSSLGKMFNQFPARIYVDGKFTPENKYKEIFSSKGVDERRFAIRDTFYSKLAKEAEVPDLPAKAQALIPYLLKKGVKPAELEWMGVDQWVKENQKDGRIDRDAFRTFLAQNQIEMKEVIKRDIGIGDISETFQTEGEARQWAEQRGTGEEVGATKFANWQIPGGTNYKEILFTLPGKSPEHGTWMKEVDRLKEKYGEDFYNSGKLTPTEKTNLERLHRAAGEGSGAIYKSSHWDEPNVVGHVRMNDRPGETLNLEEVQSDWHQEGKKRGYQGPLAVPPGYIVKEKTLDDGQKLYALGKEGDKEVGAHTGYYPELETAIREITKQFPIYERVPKAAFAENWEQVLVKRMLRYAVDNGYQKLTWLTGEVQADRYDLSKQIDKLIVWGDEAGYYYEATKNDGEAAAADEGTPLSPKQLENTIGKELSARAIKDIAAGKRAEYSGLDLKVGGEGMRVFYDEKLPGFLNKYLKQWGGKVEKGTLNPTPAGYEVTPRDNAPAPVPVWEVKITPAMQEGLQKPQALFSIRENMGILKNAFKKNEIASILIDAPKIQSGPLDGGCRVVARALKIIEPVGNIITLESKRGDIWQAEHYGLEIDGVVVDALGFSATRKEWADKFKTEENMFLYDVPTRVVEREADSNEIPQDPPTEKKLADALIKELGAQYSIREALALDTAYFRAVNKGDMETAQKMVDEAAKKAGYNIGPVYHGTIKKFTEFKPGTHFGTKQAAEERNDIAVNFGKRGERNPYIVSAYLVIDNPKRMEDQLDDDKWEIAIRQAKKEGHDGIEYLNTVEDEGSASFIAFYPPQIKSADPVTYDDGGKPIPLSIRFREERSDIRYAIQQTDKRSLGARILAGMAAPDTNVKPLISTIATHLSGESAKEGVIDHRTAGPKENRQAETALADMLEASVMKHPESSGWYRTDIERTMSILQQIHPELKNHSDNLWMRIAIAVTSDGNNTLKNMEFAEAVYRNRKETGSIVIPIASKRGVVITENLKFAEAVRKGFKTDREFEKWLLGKAPTGEIAGDLVAKLGMSWGDAKAIVNGENLDSIVPRAIIFGPKIGAFFSNLSGDFSPVTADMWFMRTMGRIQGNLMEGDTPEEIAAQRQRLRAAIKNSPRGVRAAGIEPSLFGKYTDEDLDQIAKTIARKAGPNGERFREQLHDIKGGDELRNAANFRALRLQGGATKDSPDSGAHRQWLRDRVDGTRKMLEKRGIKYENADIQAAVWIGEKEIYHAYGAKQTQGDYFSDGANALYERIHGRPSELYAGAPGEVGRRSRAGEETVPLFAVRSTVEKIYDLAKSNPKGFTIDISDGTMVTKGWTVSPTKMTETVVDTFTPDTVRDFLTRFKPIFDNDERAFFGGWYADDLESKNYGKFVLDISFVVDNFKDAAYIADIGETPEEKQDGIFSLDEKRYVRTEDAIRELRESGVYDESKRAGFRRIREQLHRSMQEGGDVHRGEPIVGHRERLAEGEIQYAVRSLQDDTGAPEEFKNKEVSLTHWSKEKNLTFTDPEKYGTGYAGAEKKNRDAYPELWISKTYVGYGKYEAEPGLGPYRYQIKVDGNGLYDAWEDPLNLYPSAEETRKLGYYTKAAQGLIHEQRIKQAGFRGYVSTPYNVVALFEKEKATRVPVSSKPAQFSISPENPEIGNVGPVVFAETTTPVTAQDYTQNRAEAGTPGKIFGPAVRQAKDELGLEVSKLMAPISTRLKYISPELSAKLRRLDRDTLAAIQGDREIVAPLLRKGKAMTRADALDWDYARKNSDTPKIDELVQRYGMQREYTATRKMFDDLRDAAIDTGLDIGEINEYWTRKVKDLKGLYGEMNREELGRFSKALAERAASLGLTVDQLDPDIRATVITNVLFGGPSGPGGVSATKERKFMKIPPRLNKYYLNSDAAVLEHIGAMRTAIEKRKFFGKIPEKVAEMRRQLYAAQAKVREWEQRIQTSATPSEASKARWKLQQWDGEVRLLEGEIWKHTLQRDYTDNIGSFIDELIVKGDIKASQENDVSEMLHARFNERGTHGFWQLYKNFSYMDTMGSPISALTQIGDLAWAMYEGGLIGGLKHAGKSLMGTSIITREDIGVSRIAEEFADQSKLGAAVTWVFKHTGLEKMDAIGKEALLNASLEKNQKLARENPTKLAGEIKHIFGDETDDTIQALKDGVITENVKMLVYSRLADFQPVGLSEMPQRYLTSGNGRIFYMLKTFTIKQFDAFRNEAIHKITHGDRAEKIQGLKNLVRLAMFFVLANAAADELKDLVLGRTTDYRDRTVDNILRLFGSSKFVTWTARTEGAGSAMAKQVLPPFKFIDSLTKDIYNAGDNKGLELTASVPLLGKLAYWHLGRGTTKRSDIWDIRFKKYKATVDDVHEDFEKAKDKQAFLKEHREEMAEYKRKNMFQGRLNNFRKIINKLKSQPEQTDSTKKRIEQLEQRRIEMIKQFLEKKETANE